MKRERLEVNKMSHYLNIDELCSKPNSNKSFHVLLLMVVCFIAENDFLLIWGLFWVNIGKYQIGCFMH